MPDIFIDPKSERHHPRKNMFPLAGFALDPKGISFANQHEKEEIHLFLRRHSITNLPWILFSLVLMVIPIIVFPLFQELLPLTAFLTPKVSFILFVFYYLLVFGFGMLANFINWYFNVYIVTNERVVDVDFINIIYREVSSTRINLVQDVTVRTGGVLRAIFDYGDVFIQTAGTETNFDFHAVPHPQQVAREIENLMREARAREGISNIEKQIEE